MRFLESGHAALGWRCSECAPGWEPGPEDPPEAEARLTRNCEGRNDLVGPSFDWAPELRQCPWAAIDPLAWDLASIWREWLTLGVLPFDGAMGDQPLWVWELLRYAQDAHEASKARRAQVEQRVTMEGLLAMARARGG